MLIYVSELCPCAVHMYAEETGVGAFYFIRVNSIQQADILKKKYNAKDSEIGTPIISDQ